MFVGKAGWCCRKKGAGVGRRMGEGLVGKGGRGRRKGVWFVGKRGGA